MPASATITAFYVFDVKEKPRVGKINNNFSVFRGHLIPVDPNTSTVASSGEYSLGDDTMRWRTAYVSKLNLSVTTTATQTLEANTAGEYVFTSNNTTATFKITDSGYVGYNNTAFPGLTSSAALGGIAVSSTLNLTIASDGGHIVGSTCTIVTNGRPVLVCLQPNLETSTAAHAFFDYPVADNARYTFDFIFYRDGSAVGSVPIRTELYDYTFYYPPGFFKIYDMPASGSHSYSLFCTTISGIKFGGSVATAEVLLTNLRVMVYEL